MLIAVFPLSLRTSHTAKLLSTWVAVQSHTEFCDSKINNPVEQEDSSLPINILNMENRNDSRVYCGLLNSSWGRYEEHSVSEFFRHCPNIPFVMERLIYICRSSLSFLEMQEWKREKPQSSRSDQTIWYHSTEKEMITHTQRIHGFLTLYIPSVLWSRSLMSWKFLCSSKGRFSIPREKRRNRITGLHRPYSCF